MKRISGLEVLAFVAAFLVGTACSVFSSEPSAKRTENAATAAKVTGKAADAVVTSAATVCEACKGYGAAKALGVLPAPSPEADKVCPVVLEKVCDGSSK